MEFIEIVCISLFESFIWQRQARPRETKSA